MHSDTKFSTSIDLHKDFESPPGRPRINETLVMDFTVMPDAISVILWTLLSPTGLLQVLNSCASVFDYFK